MKVDKREMQYDLMKMDIYNKFKENNGLRDKIDPNSDIGRNLTYKILLGLGLSQPP